MSWNKEIIVAQFDWDSFDVAVAFDKVARDNFGPDPFFGAVPRRSIFRGPVVYIPVETGLNQEAKVPTGRMKIHGIKGEFNIEGPVVQACVDKLQVPAVEKFFAEIKRQLETHSIYKGKAVTSSRGFIDLNGVGFESLVYNERILRELNENLWVLIEKTQQCRSAGIPIRRKVLLEGKFGTGKTMSILYTIKKAIDNGFTAFYVEPTAPDISKAIEFMFSVTKRYKPTLLAIEDFDREQRARDPYAMASIMMAIDGMLSKNSEIIIVLSTNFKDKIAGAFKRPGRIDKTINFNAFNSADAQKLLRIVIPADYLCPKINWEHIGDIASRMTPAFVKEVGTGSVLAGISRANNGETPLVTEGILIEVIDGLQDQHKACEAVEQIGFQS